MTNKTMCFLLGISAGAAVALLYAPKSGQRTRATIVGKAKKGRRYVEHQADQVRDTLDRGREMFIKATDGVKAAAAKGRHAFGD